MYSHIFGKKNKKQKQNKTKKQPNKPKIHTGIAKLNNIYIKVSISHRAILKSVDI